LVWIQSIINDIIKIWVWNNMKEIYDLKVIWGMNKMGYCNILKDGWYDLYRLICIYNESDEE
jgi:hypothetical protein